MNQTNDTPLLQTTANSMITTSAAVSTPLSTNTSAPTSISSIAKTPNTNNKENNEADDMIKNGRSA